MAVPSGVFVDEGSMQLALRAFGEVPSSAHVVAALKTNYSAEFGLLDVLATQALREFQQTEGRQTAGPADRFRARMLAQTLNAELCVLRLLIDGYPRQAASFVRHLREGHIAARWAEWCPEETSAYVTAGRELPKSGNMAKHVVAAWKVESPTDSRAWNDAMLKLKDAHDAFATHAVSGWALYEAAEVCGDQMLIHLGPHYDERIYEALASHLMPLFIYVLQDASVYAEPSRTSKVATETTRVLSAAHKWGTTHPMLLIA